MRQISIISSTIAIVALSSCSGGMQMPAEGLAQASDVANEHHCAVTWSPNNKYLPCRANRSPSWMKKTSGALLYVSDIGAEDVDIFTYPTGKLVGTLTGFQEPNGLCADKKGDVFVTDAGAHQILEYARGGTKPIATLDDGKLGPIGCAIDPTTGDLAVSNNQWLVQGTVAVYKGATGTPTVYKSLFRTFFCTYDDKGNLFVDGFNNEGGAAVSELAKGSSVIEMLSFNGSIGWTGGISWDGKHLAVGDQFANKFVSSRDYVNAVYQMSLKNGTLTIAKTAPLVGAGDVVQFWLQGNTIVAPDARNEDVGYFKYPVGGKATSSIGGFYEPVGATISQ
jgi:DNA-binding beta-propeller fold protein YncE